MDGFHGIHPSLLLLLGPVRGVQYTINKYSFINKCWYFKEFLFKRSDYYIGRTVCNINENIFKEGRMDITTKK